MGTRKQIFSSLLVLAMTGLGACAEEPSVSRLLDATAFRSYTPEQCGALFTVSVTEDDPDVAEFDMPSSVTETEEVCETWTGGDYAFSSTTLSATDADPNAPELVVRADYSNDQLTPMGADGSRLQSPETVDPSFFDLLNASQDLRDASFDDPYYGVYGSGGGGGGEECPPSDPYCNNMTSLVPDDSVMGGRAGARYTRHSIARKGVRALLENAAEVESGNPHSRRFRRQFGDGFITYTLDRKTQLVLEEEVKNDSVRILSRNSWEKHGAGYVRALRIVEETSSGAGRSRTLRTTIRLSNLHMNGVRVQAPTTP